MLHLRCCGCEANGWNRRISVELLRRFWQDGAVETTVHHCSSDAGCPKGAVVTAANRPSRAEIAGLLAATPRNCDGIEASRPRGLQLRRERPFFTSPATPLGTHNRKMRNLNGAFTSGGGGTRGDSGPPPDRMPQLHPPPEQAQAPGVRPASGSRREPLSPRVSGPSRDTAFGPAGKPHPSLKGRRALYPRPALV